MIGLIIGIVFFVPFVFFWLRKQIDPPMARRMLLIFALGGWPALVWGFFVSTTLLWHGTFTINSLTHVFGRRRYPTTEVVFIAHHTEATENSTDSERPTQATAVGFCQKVCSKPLQLRA